MNMAYGDSVAYEWEGNKTTGRQALVTLCLKNQLGLLRCMQGAMEDEGLHVSAT